MKTVAIEWSFFDFDSECGLGEVDIDVTLICDCDDRGAELKEVLFRRIVDNDNVEIYSHGDESLPNVAVLHDFVCERCRDRWSTILEPVAMASFPIQYPLVTR